MEGRATNSKPRLSGDPERWGAHSTAVLTGWTIVGLTKLRVFSSQLLRAETRDLVAIAWDLLVVSTVTGLDVADKGALALELTIGTGQANSTLLLLCGTIAAGAIAAQNPAALAAGYLPTDPNGAANVAISGFPIVATSLSARALLFVESAVPHVVNLDVNAHCAPRSWVP